MRDALLPLCLAIALAALGAVLGRAELAGPPDVPGFLWPAQPEIQPFALADARGGVFDQDALRGRWTLAFLGYTHCPDICPTTLETLAAMQRALRDYPPWQAAGQVLFVSIDAERDTPARLAQYVGSFDPGFRAATAAPPDLHLFVTQLDMNYRRVSADAATPYWFEHSTHLVLIGPSLKIYALFDPPHVADVLAARLHRLLDYLTDPARTRAP